jgi:hypothetical protein
MGSEQLLGESADTQAVLWGSRDVESKEQNPTCTGRVDTETAFVTSSVRWSRLCSFVFSALLFVERFGVHPGGF